MSDDQPPKKITDHLGNAKVETVPTASKVLEEDAQYQGKLIEGLGWVSSP